MKVLSKVVFFGCVVPYLIFNILSSVNAAESLTAPPNSSPFVSNFFKLLKNSDALTEAFTKGYEVTKSPEKLTKVNTDVATKFGAKNPEAVAKKVGESVESVASVLTASSHTSAFVSAVEHVLKDEKVLTEKNAEELSKKYFDLSEKKVKEAGHELTPEESLTTTDLAMVEFLKSTVKFTPEIPEKFVDHFIQELKALKK